MSHIYEVGPINYFNLSEPEQNAVLAAFAASLQQLSSSVVFHVKLDTMSVVVGNELYSVKYRRYFLESDEPLEGFLATIGLQEKYVRLMDMPGYTVASNPPRYVVLDSGDLAKAYTVTGLSSDLDVAFLAMDRGEVRRSTASPALPGGNQSRRREQVDNLNSKCSQNPCQ